MVSKMKGEDYNMDPALPTGYLLHTCWVRLWSMLWGRMRLHTLKSVMVHPTAVIRCSRRMHFGKGLDVGRRCYIDALSREGLVLGHHVSMGHYTHIQLTGSLHHVGMGMTVGNYVGLGTHGYYGSGKGRVKIGDHTIFGNYVSIHPENHNTDDPTRPIREQGTYSKGGVTVGCRCWIGAKATLLDGTDIGDDCIVAAGAVVSGTFPRGTVIGGVPARVLSVRPGFEKQSEDKTAQE